MARPAFTINLFEENPLAHGVPVVIGSPPAGFRWVVRDIVAWNSGAGGALLTGVFVQSAFGAPIFTVEPPVCRPHQLFHWEGRQVFDSSEQLELFTGDTGWFIRGCAYLLSA